MQTAGNISGLSPGDCGSIFTQPVVCFCVIRNLCYTMHTRFVCLDYVSII
jgi:hypothetical protein